MLKAEAEHFVKSLKAFAVNNVASTEWIQQMIKIEQLNVRAHQQASGNQFEEIVDLIKTYEMFGTLVHELIASDMYLSQALPKIKPKLSQTAFVRLFIIERSMTTLLNLIELVVFKPETLDSEHLIPLVDFCVMKVVALLSLDLKALTVEEPSEALKTAFSIGFSSLSILWCISCACSDEAFPISVTKRLVSENDVIPTLAELIVKQPWKTVKAGKIIKWSDSGLSTLPPAEALRVCKPEAHAWTALQQLLEPRSQSLATWNESKRQALLQIEGMLSEVLIDQLPPLEGLKRTLQMLRVSEFPQPKFTPVLEIVPQMTEEFSQKFDWDDIAKKSLRHYEPSTNKQFQKEMMEISEFLSIFAE